MKAASEGFDPLGRDYLMRVVVLNAHRTRLNLGVSILIEHLVDEGEEELLGDFIQLIGTGVVYGTSSSSFTDEDLQHWSEFLHNLPDGEPEMDEDDD